MEYDFKLLIAITSLVFTLVNTYTWIDKCDDCKKEGTEKMTTPKMKLIPFTVESLQTQTTEIPYGVDASGT